MTQKTILASFILFILLSTATAKEWVPDRRIVKGDQEFGWFVSPTPINIKGIGGAVPFNVILTNIYGTGDVMILDTPLKGDFQMSLVSIMQMPIYWDNLKLSIGKMKGQFPVTVYNRGIDSDPEAYSIPLYEQEGIFFKTVLNFWEDRLGFFYQTVNFKSKTSKYYDKDGNEFEYPETIEGEYKGKTYGAILDLTDSAFDPRDGFRFGVRHVPAMEQSNPLNSESGRNDVNFNWYQKMFEHDTLVFGFFESRAFVAKEGLTDLNALQQIFQVSCESTPDPTECQAKVDQQVEDARARNLYGNAYPMGGPNRLRSYAMSRFQAGNSAYQGIEYRLNFSDEETPINWFVLGGVKTIFQIAFFAEKGTVTDDPNQLYSGTQKYSYGAGFRALISGFVYRFDLAFGDEGPGLSVFVDYPMELTPVTE